jgi:6-phosphogluconolactonase
VNTSEYLVYVSCGGDQEILCYAMGRATGELALLGKTGLPVAREGAREERPAHGGLATTGAPLAVSPDGSVLYASLREPPIGLASYRIDRETGALELLAQAPIMGSTPFILAEPAGRFIFGASYYGSGAWVSRTEPDGSVVSPPCTFVEGIRKPHSVLLHPNNRFAYVAATGHEEILTFYFDDETGGLVRTGTPGSKAISGATPRHMAIHPNEELLFCMNETSGIIDSFRIDSEQGLLTRVDSADPRPPEHREGHGIGADLHLSPDGRFLYGSERVRSTISVHAVDAATGKLTFVEAVPAGKFPRSFAIDPSGRFLVAAGQGSYDLTVFAVDPGSGRLSKITSFATGGDPIWVEIVDPDRQ